MGCVQITWFQVSEPPRNAPDSSPSKPRNSSRLKLIQRGWYKTSVGKRPSSAKHSRAPSSKDGRNPGARLIASLALAAALTLSGCGNKHVSQLATRAFEGDTLARGELMSMGEARRVNDGLAVVIGQMWDPGIFPDGDARRAASFYKRARNTEPAAAHNLAVLVLTGEISLADAGLSEDSLQELVLSAAERGLPDAMLLAGEFYTLGVRSFPQNEVLAAWWFEKAVAASGDPWARYRLGAAYLNGKIRGPKRHFAYDLLSASAKAGVPEAADLLAKTASDAMVATRWSIVSARMKGSTAPAWSLAVGGVDNIGGVYAVDRMARDVDVWVQVHKDTWTIPMKIIRPVAG